MFCYKLITQIYKILEGSYTNVNFNNFLFWSIVFFIASILFSILLFFKKQYSLKSKLKQIIYNNNFYSKNDNVKEISKSSFFLFYKKSSKLFLEFHPNGLSVANRMNELQPILETALNMYIEEIDDSKPNYTLYVLSGTNGEIESMLAKNGEPYIQLDKEKKWFWHLDPMGQVSGPRSSGKTFFLYYLMLCVAEIGADIYIIDPKRSDFSSLKYCYPEELRNSHVATTPSTICQLLRELTELMNFRYEKYFQISSSTLGFDAQNLGLRPIFIFFDEVLALIEEDKKLGKEAEQYIKQIILKGKQSGIYIIISSQRLSADTLNTVIRENCEALRAFLRSGFWLILLFKSKTL